VAGVKYLGLDLIRMMFSGFVAKQNWMRNDSSWNQTFASFAVVQSVVQSYRKKNQKTKNHRVIKYHFKRKH